jgi:DNA-binding NarL/FixJ family response regulator
MPSTVPAIMIMLVDDHAVVRAGYKRYLELDPTLSVVAEAASGEQAYAQLLTQTVDVVVMDLSMPGQGGFETLRRILARSPKQKIIVFTMHENAAMAQQALQLGASGYLTKSLPPDEIVQAIHRVIAGERPLAASLEMPKSYPNGTPHAELLPREFEVLGLLVEGRSNEVIASKLHISERTAANYVTSVRKKLGVSSHYEIREYAERFGLLANMLKPEN